MNWYKRIIIAQGVEQYLSSLGATPDIIQYILSQGGNTQYLVNEFRKNPGITKEQLETFQFPQKKEGPYKPTMQELSVVLPYPEPLKTWLLMNMKAIRKQEYHALENSKAQIHDFYTKFIEQVPLMWDWYRFAHPDISGFTPEQAMAAQQEWHEATAGKGSGKMYEKTNPELIMYGPNWQNPEWNGWTIQKVVSENDLSVEGDRMNHCVGEYCEDIERGYAIIYSLRDPGNNPKVTIEVNRNGGIEQIKGNSNEEPEEIYKNMIKEWISTSADKAGINREIGAMEQLEETHNYDSPSVDDITETLGDILQGGTNEYGLKLVLDEDIIDITERLLNAGKDEGRAYNRHSDKEYTGDITSASDYPVSLAMMQDLGMDSWPKNAGEWAEFRKTPKKSNWKNIRELEEWAHNTIDDTIESIDVYSYDTGVELPQEEDYEDPKEFEKALEIAEGYEQDVYDEWIRNTIPGGFSKDILDDINKYRKEGWIPSPEELYAIEKAEKEEAVNKALSKYSPTSRNASRNWYKAVEK